MKTVEQKAKAYDEVIGKLQSLINNTNKQNHIIRIEDIENSFPELKESEDDRIRKAIMEFFELQDNNITYSFIPKKDILTLLEKQGSYTKKDVDDAYLKGISDAKNEIEKQYEASYQIRKDIATFIFNYRGDLKDRAKWMRYLGIRVSFVKNQDEKNPQPSLILKSALEAAKEEKVDNQNCVKPDKNEPEFHEGEWVVYNHDICQIVKREEGCNKLVTVFGIEKELVNERNLSTAHLWTIQDAKDGDVLVIQKTSVTYESIFIFNKIENNLIIQYLHYFTTDAGEEVFETRSINGFLGFVGTTVHPATKEQRDLLFQKMAEAGYEWNASKKELKKIEDEPENYKQQLMSEITDLVEDYISQKPTWSEEDEKILQWIITDIKRLINDDKKANVIANKEPDWLITLKERIGG